MTSTINGNWEFSTTVKTFPATSHKKKEHWFYAKNKTETRGMQYVGRLIELKNGECILESSNVRAEELSYIQMEVNRIANGEQMKKKGGFSYVPRNL